MTREPDEVPRPPIHRLCKPCRVTQRDVDANAVIVSPSGTAHRGRDYGMTVCSKDGTYPKWWWPL